jgi:hypothetical protein
MCGGSGSSCIEELVAPCPSYSTRPRTHSLPAHSGGVGSGVGNAVSTTVMCNAREVRTSAWLPAARESRLVSSQCSRAASTNHQAPMVAMQRCGPDERCGGGRRGEVRVHERDRQVRLGVVGIGSVRRYG